ncbi:MAG: alanine racemase [Myxococcota bacterium]
MIDDVLLEAVSRLGTPCYVYDADAIAERVAQTRAAFGGRCELSYAVKANPNAALLRFLGAHADRLDVSSGGEVERAIEAGWPGDALSFTGPGKREAELEASVAHGVGHHVLESVEEARDLDRVARHAGAVVPVLLRITPNAAARGFGLTMAGRPCAFGVDEDDAAEAVSAIAACPNLSLRGFHVYAATQGLDVDPVVEQLQIGLALFRERWVGDDPAEAFVLGAGFGIPCHEGERALDLGEVSARVVPLLDAFRSDPRFSAATLTLELGRYLVGEAGTYVTRVVRVKESRGRRFAICDGGMNHHLAAAGHFGAVVPRNYPLRRLGETGAPVERVELVGPLCTTIDTLGRKARLPRLEPGDLVAIGCSGAYGRSASPLGFISHPLPAEGLVRRTPEGVQVEEVTDGVAAAGRAER